MTTSEENNHQNSLIMCIEENLLDMFLSKVKAKVGNKTQYTGGLVTSMKQPKIVYIDQQNKIPLSGGMAIMSFSSQMMNFYSAVSKGCKTIGDELELTDIEVLSFTNKEGSVFTIVDAFQYGLNLSTTGFVLMGKKIEGTNSYHMSNYLVSTGNELIFQDPELKTGDRYIFFEYSPKITLKEMKGTYQGLLKYSDKDDPLMFITFNCVARGKRNLRATIGEVLKGAVPKHIPFVLIQCGGEISPMSVKITGCIDNDDLIYSTKEDNNIPHSTGFSTITNLITIKNRLKMSMSK